MLYRTFLKWLLIFFTSLGLCITIAAYLLFSQLSADLPDVKTLHQVHYQIPLRIYSQEHLLIAQFGEKKRAPVRIEEIPAQLIHAFLAAEDDRFFEHPGIDYQGLLRAGLQLLLTGNKSQGGSTITMQVARNFLLSSEKTYTRKLREIILALKIEQEYSKNRILELYLNQIYLGHRAYGIAAAAQTYYGKTLNELTLAECAMIAGLPKAPSAYNPVSNEPRALERRNYVLRRMLNLDYISQQAFDEAIHQASTAKLQVVTTEVDASYLAEMVRQILVTQYGDRAYTSGFKVYTTVNAALQKEANQALMNGLHAYDERHGYRLEPITKTDFKDLPIIGDTWPARIIANNNRFTTARLQDNSLIEIPRINSSWAFSFKSDTYSNALTNSLKPGAIIRVRQLKNATWALAQIPEAEGAFVALNPANGAILALTGGFDFSRSKYNRATQSKRQPGSGFKPVVYAAALEEGYTPASIINDAPIVVDGPGQENEWRPENYSGKFFGATTLRTALSQSRNIIAVRLLNEIGIETATSMALRFGFTEAQLPNTLSFALGSGYASPLQMARVYATFANGGFLVKPYFIERIESSEGEIIYQARPRIACPQCDNKQELNKPYAKRILSPRINFLINSLLRDVVQHGTATRAKALNRQDLAGKTGTTNEQRDAWFNGYTPDIAATAWVGFDNFKPLGALETGGAAALPIWIEFMQTALKNAPEVPFVAPDGIVKAFINPATGLLAPADSKAGIWEFFQAELAPTLSTPTSQTSEDNHIDDNTADNLPQEPF